MQSETHLTKPRGELRHLVRPPEAEGGVAEHTRSDRRAVARRARVDETNETAEPLV